MKKLLAILIATVMAASLLTGCTANTTPETTEQEITEKDTKQSEATKEVTSAEPANDSQDENTETEAADPENAPVVRILFNDYYGNGCQDMQLVTDALNEILVPRYNLKVEFDMTESSALEEQLTLKVIGNEKVDLVFSVGNLGLKYQTQDMFLDMAPYMDSLLADAKAAFYDNGISEILDRCYLGDSLYYLPNIEPKAIGMMLIANKDQLDEIGMAEEFDKITCMEDMDAIYAAYHEKYPDNYAFGNFMPSTTLISGEGYILWNSMAEMNSMTDGLGVLENWESDTVVDLYETEGYMSAAKMLRDWYNKGYIMKDIATSTEMGFNFFKSQKQFTVKMTTEMDEEETNAWLERIITDFPAVAKAVSPQIINSTRGAVMMPVTATEPEAAMRLVNALYKDKDVMNLFCYGIEGTHWELNDEGAVVFYNDEGELGNDANTKWSTPFFMCIGNMAICDTKASVGGVPYREKIYTRNAAATLSKTYGFSYDSAAVDAEVSACTNAVAEFKMGIETGSVDPETEIPKLIEKLKDSGIDDIIAEKQQQYDAFLGK